MIVRRPGAYFFSLRETSSAPTPRAVGPSMDPVRETERRRNKHAVVLEIHFAPGKVKYKFGLYR